MEIFNNVEKNDRAVKRKKKELYEKRRRKKGWGITIKTIQISTM